jgi:1-deoxyxylulose-5-phosphate synthase
LGRTHDRREFLKSSVIGAGTLAVLGTAGLQRAFAGGTAADRVTLGKTGITASRLAQGTGFNGGGRSSQHTRLGQQGFDTLVRYSIDQGVNFMDSADLYGSHPFLRSTLKGIPRDKYVLLSKIWPRQESWNDFSGGAKAEVDRFRQELNADVIDICMIHCAMDRDWTDSFARVRDELSELKSKGVIRATGVSCHDFGALEVAASDPWTDVVLARINHKGGREYSMDGTVEAVSDVLRLARRNGKGVVGMKIFGAGKLIQPDEKDASLKYVFGNDLVDAVTIGMLSKTEVEDTVKRMAQALRS